jgi:hypothetical protein
MANVETEEILSASTAVGMAAGHLVRRQKTSR